MAKAWIENNQIYVTVDATIAPANAIDVPDGVLQQDLVVDNGVLRLKTNAEKL